MASAWRTKITQKATSSSKRKLLKEDRTVLQQAGGEAVKVVLPLLPHLPAGQQYHVLFIGRILEEIFASQKAMLDRHAATAQDPAALRPAHERLLRQNRQRLTTNPKTRTLRLAHRWVVQHPLAAAQSIAEFLGRPMNVEAMAAMVDPQLHRQRAKR